MRTHRNTILWLQTFKQNKESKCLDNIIWMLILNTITNEKIKVYSYISAQKEASFQKRPLRTAYTWLQG